MFAKGKKRGEKEKTQKGRQIKVNSRLSTKRLTCK
jgi:hypothetical protein